MVTEWVTPGVTEDGNGMGHAWCYRGWLRNGSRLVLPRMVTEWVTPGVTEDGNGMGHAWCYRGWPEFNDGSSSAPL